MTQTNRELLAGYLDDSLSQEETSQLEQALRDSDVLRRQLRSLMQERDRGEHSLGAIWRRNRLTCPTRETLGSYLLGVLEPDHGDYVEFHLRTVGCSYCLANFADLQSQQEESKDNVKQRRQRLYRSSAGYLSKTRK